MVKKIGAIRNLTAAAADSNICLNLLNFMKVKHSNEFKERSISSPLIIDVTINYRGIGYISD
jgi:hypothetical protein